MPDTDGNGIIDSEEKIMQEASFEIACEEKPEITQIDIALNAAGNIEKTLKIENMYNVNMFSTDLVGLSGAPIDITTSSKFDKAEVTFTYDQSLISSDEASELGVLWFNEAEGIYEDMDAVVDLNSGTVSFETNHFSEYSVCNIVEFNKAINDIPDYTTDGTSNNIGWDGEILTLAQASSKFNISQSDLTAMSGSKGLYIVQGTGIYNLYDGQVLSIPHKYFSTTKMDENSPYIARVSADTRRCVAGIRNWSTIYTTQTYPKDYDFGTMPNGSKAYVPYTADVKSVSVINTKRYFIPVSGFNTTDTDRDGLYDVYEIEGMRMSNGTLLKTDHLNPDCDGDSLKDGQEVIRYSKGNGFFVMKSNPWLADSDGDGILDPDDEFPLIKANDTKGVALNAQLQYIGSEVAASRTFKVTAYAHNNTGKILENAKLSLEFENKADILSIVDLNPYAYNPPKHLLADEYKTYSWRFTVKDDAELNDLKWKVKFSADNYDEISVDKSINVVENPDYLSLNMKVLEDYRAPEIRGDGVFAIEAYLGCVADYYEKLENTISAVTDIEVELIFDDPDAVTMLDDFHDTSLKRTINMLADGDNSKQCWEFKFKEDYIPESFGYTVKVTSKAGNIKEDYVLDMSSSDKVFVKVELGEPTGNGSERNATFTIFSGKAANLTYILYGQKSGLIKEGSGDSNIISFDAIIDPSEDYYLHVASNEKQNSRQRSLSNNPFDTTVQYKISFDEDLKMALIMPSLAKESHKSLLGLLKENGGKAYTIYENEEVATYKIFVGELEFGRNKKLTINISQFNCFYVIDDGDSIVYKNFYESDLNPILVYRLDSEWVKGTGLYVDFLVDENYFNDLIGKAVGSDQDSSKLSKWLANIEKPAKFSDDYIYENSDDKNSDVLGVKPQNVKDGFVTIGFGHIIQTKEDADKYYFETYTKQPVDTIESAIKVQLEEYGTEFEQIEGYGIKFENPAILTIKEAENLIDLDLSNFISSAEDAVKKYELSGLQNQIDAIASVMFNSNYKLDDPEQLIYYFVRNDKDGALKVLHTAENEGWYGLHGGLLRRRLMEFNIFFNDNYKFYDSTEMEQLKKDIGF